MLLVAKRASSQRIIGTRGSHWVCSRRRVADYCDFSFSGPPLTRLTSIMMVMSISMGAYFSLFFAVNLFYPWQLSSLWYFVFRFTHPWSRKQLIENCSYAPEKIRIAIKVIKLHEELRLTDLLSNPKNKFFYPVSSLFWCFSLS